MTTFIIRPKNSKALRDEFVKWLRDMQSREANDMKISYGKRAKLNCEVRMIAYQRAAEFWERVQIKKESA